MTDRRGHLCRRDIGVGCWSPDQGQPHQRVNVVGALKQQAIVALQFAMVSGENDVGIRLPAAIAQIVKDPRAGVVDVFVFNVGVGSDLPDLVGVMSQGLKPRGDSRLAHRLPSK